MEFKKANRPRSSRQYTAPRLAHDIPIKKVGIIAGIVIIGTVWFFASHSSNSPSSHQSNSTAGSNNAPDSNSQAAKAPSYPVVLPGGKSIDELGGWKRISPPKNDPVFAYSDQIGGVPITVSQQQLPQSLAQHSDDQIADLAKKFNATTKLVAGDTTAYIGTSSKGPQSVILTEKKLLILIKSQKKIDNNAWIAYIKTLK